MDSDQNILMWAESIFYMLMIGRFCYGPGNSLNYSGDCVMLLQRAKKGYSIDNISMEKNQVHQKLS